MRDLSHVKKVEEMINGIKAMNLSLPEKMYYVYHLFLEDLTEEMKEDLRTDLALRNEMKELEEKDDNASKKRIKEIQKELLERDRGKAKELPQLVEKIKAEVTEYADSFEQRQWTAEEEKRKEKEEEMITKIKKQITKGK